MLSILIITKDYDCRKLVVTLHAQCEQTGHPFEILVGEDGSTPAGLRLNAELEQLPNCRIVTLQQNVGRAKIRNILAAEASHPNLLFIDSDAMVERELFVKNYLDALQNHSVVCGGLYHDTPSKCNGCTLRYKYEKAADKKRGAAERNKKPYDKFTTFNFAIRRDLFLSIKFDEDIKSYGYEDTLFGYRLQEKNVKIFHIDNPLLHTGLESNSAYLSKVEESIKTLVSIRGKIGETKLLKYVKKAERLHMTKFIALCWQATLQLTHKNLMSNNPSLLLLDFHKLGYMCHLLQK